jgi:hypothetical protein
MMRSVRHGDVKVGAKGATVNGGQVEIDGDYALLYPVGILRRFFGAITASGDRI